jgi:hypothetical protein
MKKEVIQSLEREKNISVLAIERINDLLNGYEKKYSLATNDFLIKFNDGSLGDDEDFFKWYSLIQALKDWQSTKKALEETIAN